MLPSNLFFGRPICSIICTFDSIFKKNYITKINVIQISNKDINKLLENINTNVIGLNQKKKKKLPQIICM